MESIPMCASNCSLVNAQGMIALTLVRAGSCLSMIFSEKRRPLFGTMLAAGGTKTPQSAYGLVKGAAESFLTGRQRPPHRVLPARPFARADVCFHGWAEAVLPRPGGGKAR